MHVDALHRYKPLCDVTLQGQFRLTSTTVACLAESERIKECREGRSVVELEDGLRRCDL